MPQIVGTLTKNQVERSKSKDDRAFLLATLALEVKLQQQLDSTTNSMMAETQRHTRGDKVQDQKALSDSLAGLLAAYNAQVYKDTVASIKIVAQAKADLAMKQVAPILLQAGADSWYRDLKTQVGTYANQVSQRFPYKRAYGTTFTNQIKTLQSGYEKTVRSIIDKGVNDGMSSSQIARRIEQYVNPVPGMPKTRPFDVYRERFGRPTSFTPRGVPSGTVQFNSMRIARTESANVYRQSTLDFYAGKDYVAGYDWVLSGSHPEVDVCDDYASGSPYKHENEVPSAPHPFCLCDIVVRTKSVDEIRMLYNATS